MITGEEMYWLTRLDPIRERLNVLIALCVIAIAIIAIA